MTSTKTPIPKTDRVTAKFGGEELVFAIDRDRLPIFELAIGEPAQRRLARISSGNATVREIIEVLEYAAPQGKGRKLPATAGDVGLLQARRTLDDLRPPKPTFVASVFSANPPLRYAVLAQGILAAALHGIPVDAAHFNEDEADVDG